MKIAGYYLLLLGSPLLGALGAAALWLGPRDPWPSRWPVAAVLVLAALAVTVCLAIPAKIYRWVTVSSLALVAATCAFEVATRPQAFLALSFFAIASTQAALGALLVRTGREGPG
jgi:hypothetical protein